MKLNEYKYRNEPLMHRITPDKVRWGYRLDFYCPATKAIWSRHLSGDVPNWDAFATVIEEADGRPLIPWTLGLDNGA